MFYFTRHLCFNQFTPNKKVNKQLRAFNKRQKISVLLFPGQIILKIIFIYLNFIFENDEFTRIHALNLSIERVQFFKYKEYSRIMKIMI